MFKRILIANRGEIARRVARTCARLGVEYVAVYSEADRDAAHLDGAVETIDLGAAAPAQSYLNIEKIVAAAKATRSEAIHPGYGFLSENADFAAAVEAAGIAFIGPRPETIALLGDKARAKQAMRDSGVPTIPGSSHATDDLAAIRSLASEVGYPLLLKPSAGGGGKGMELVRNSKELRAAAERAVRLAEANFGDGRLIVERYVEKPRHVEVQIVGDGAGHAVHVFERECSLQRRHQKVVEEAPAIQLPPQTRRTLLSAAVKGAEALDYRNAGTFEFVVDDAGAFYFLEVNTRLQVEHPVSEEITGVDLVEWQLRIAAGEGVPAKQSEIVENGAAVEVRIYAEDPAQAFQPSPGRAHSVFWPEGVRVEAAFDDEGVIPSFYDPLIAKLIAYGDNRAEALDRMTLALSKARVLGVKTNAGFLSALLGDPDVRAGRIHTKFLDENEDRFDAASSVDMRSAVAAAAMLRWAETPPGDDEPWRKTTLDRSDLAAQPTRGWLTLWLDGNRCDVAVVDWSPQKLTLRHGADEITVTQLNLDDGGVTGVIDGASFWARVTPDLIEGVISGSHFTAKPYQAHEYEDEGLEEGGCAPLDGVIVSLNVDVGDCVKNGDALLAIEAMKMEYVLRATSEGRVSAVHANSGEQVQAGQLLVSIERDA